MPYQLVLRDPKLHVLLSNEGMIPDSSYPIEAAGAPSSDGSVR